MAVQGNVRGKAIMPDYIRRRVPGGCYFFTVNLHDRTTRLLTENIDLLRDVVQTVHRDLPFHIDAAVVLPEHLHMIWTMPIGDANYADRWRRIKASFSRRIEAGESRSRSRRRRGERGIWQRRFWEHTIADDEDFERHVDYTHYNPVKHGLVSKPIDWPHSTIHRYVRDGVLDADWGTGGVAMDMDLG
jgi:putative transposase